MFLSLISPCSYPIQHKYFPDFCGSGIYEQEGVIISNYLLVITSILSVGTEGMTAYIRMNSLIFSYTYLYVFSPLAWRNSLSVSTIKLFGYGWTSDQA